MSNSKNPLDKFDSRIVDIVLKLVQEEDIDPQDAAMDILDIINEKMLKEDIQWRAGIVEQAPQSTDDAIGHAISELMEIFEEIQDGNATPKHIQARLGDVIQILRQGIQVP